MKPKQKYQINNTELFMMPFTTLNITQGSEIGTHRGTKAIDTTDGVSGRTAPYYAPAKVKCVWCYEGYEYMWQTVNSVRCPNGYVGKVTFLVAHDTDKHWLGQVIEQGEQLGRMSMVGGGADGVHCHIELEQGSSTAWRKNPYGIYMLDNEAYIDDVCFTDHTTILNGMSGNWRTTDNILIDKHVERDSNKDQLKITNNPWYPTARKTPDVNGYLLGFLVEGIYDILDKKVVGNITWYKVAEDVWFDFSKDWCEILDKDNTSELKKEIDNLKEKLNIANKKIEELTQMITQIKEIVK